MSPEPGEPQNCYTDASMFSIASLEDSFRFIRNCVHYFRLQIQQIIWNNILLTYLPLTHHKSIQDMLEFNEVNGELGEILLKKFTNQFRNGYVKSRGYVLPEYYKKFGQRVEELEVRDDDLWVVSFPKTGKCISSHIKYIC